MLHDSSSYRNASLSLMPDSISDSVSYTVGLVIETGTAILQSVHPSQLSEKKFTFPGNLDTAMTSLCSELVVLSNHL